MIAAIASGGGGGGGEQTFGESLQQIIALNNSFGELIEKRNEKYNSTITCFKNVEYMLCNLEKHVDRCCKFEEGFPNFPDTYDVRMVTKDLTKSVETYPQVANCVDFQQRLSKLFAKMQKHKEKVVEFLEVN